MPLPASHLIRPQLTPVDMRVESLREDYGFTCECERCTSELVNMDKVRPHGWRIAREGGRGLDLGGTG